MPSSHPFWQLFLSRLREFFREWEALFWVYGFPVLLAVGLGVAFWSSEPEPTEVDVARLPGTGEPEALAGYLAAAGVKARLVSEEEGRLRLYTGKTPLLVFARPGGYEYLYDRTRPEGVSARHQLDSLVLRWKAGPQALPVTEAPVTEPGTRYIDFLVPGLIGMNLMGGGLWGVGFVIVDMRVRKLLKRLLATPMRRGHFLLAVLTSRMVFMIPEMVLLLLVGSLGFGVPVRGGLVAVAVIILLGASAFSGIGLLVACRADKTETVSGLMNLVMLPMWLLSGVFFSSARYPDAAQPFIQALPLTQLIDALREVMLEGATLLDVGGRLAVLAAYAVVTFALALRWFRWQ